MDAITVKFLDGREVSLVGVVSISYFKDRVFVSIDNNDVEDNDSFVYDLSDIKLFDVYHYVEEGSWYE